MYSSLTYSEKKLLIHIVVTDDKYSGGVIPMPSEIENLNLHFVKTALRRTKVNDLTPHYRPQLKNIKEKLLKGPKYTLNELSVVKAIDNYEKMLLNWEREASNDDKDEDYYEDSYMLKILIKHLKKALKQSVFLTNRLDF